MVAILFANRPASDRVAFRLLMRCGGATVYKVSTRRIPAERSVSATVGSAIRWVVVFSCYVCAIGCRPRGYYSGNLISKVDNPPQHGEQLLLQRDLSSGILRCRSLKQTDWNNSALG